MMIARTRDGDPVWRVNGKGRPFIIEEDGQTMRRLGCLWRLGWRMRFLPPPLLSYHQVSVALVKSKTILKALARGPIYLERGFLKGSNGQLLTTSSMSAPVLHWMEGCGFVFTRETSDTGRVRIDIDVRGTRKNKVK